MQWRNPLGLTKAQKAGTSAFNNYQHYFSPKLLHSLREDGPPPSPTGKWVSQNYVRCCQRAVSSPPPHPLSQYSGMRSFHLEPIIDGDVQRNLLGALFSHHHRLYPARMGRNRRLDVRSQVQCQGLRRPCIPKP